MIEHTTLDHPGWLKALNQKQRQAIDILDGPLLVLAGAGTGKTRVLITRLAQLLALEKARPFQIAAVTFTNKAAREMNERLGVLVGAESQGVFSGTFHSLSLRILRAHAEIVGLKSGFTIIDTDDQIRLLKRIMEDAHINGERWPVRNLCWLIQRWKDRAWNDNQVPEDEIGSFADGKAVMLYGLYQKRLLELNACDFGDLLLHVLNLFSRDHDILKIYSDRLHYLLVDEYQDTNVAQYLWLRYLAGGHGNICCVGDDDQSIYGWRGAEISNILRFEEDFPGAKTVRLEQNYRSTPHILAAASHIIANNRSRLGKTLWTEAKEGEKISLHGLPDATEEALHLTGIIIKQQRLGDTLDQMAILVRAGFQTREIEEALLQSNVPYRIIGGARFYEREEIRDIIAYLRIVHHQGDDLAFERVINKPARGIGPVTLDLLRHIGRERAVALFEAGELALQEKLLKPQAARHLEKSLQQFRDWSARSQKLALPELGELIARESSYLAFWKNSKRIEAPSKLENIRELFASMEEMGDLESFLEHISLITDIEAAEEKECVTVMTMHGAKGLEFDTVFLSGWEEGLFPSRRTLEESNIKGLEEERRLAYVALTRARKKVHISFAMTRQIHGQWQPGIPSRFIEELPKDHLVTVPIHHHTPHYTQPYKRRHSSKNHGSSNKLTASSYNKAATGQASYAPPPFKKGDPCQHKNFGKGEVIEIDGRFIRAHFPGKGNILLSAKFLEKPETS